jgi:hypothetical protein
MKFSAEKAGKRAKCPKCDAIVLIKAEEEAPQVKAGGEEKPQVKAGAEEAAAAVAAPVVAAAPPDDDDDGEGAYEVKLDPELEMLKKKREEEERAKARERRKRQALPKVARKQKAIADKDVWDKVRWGLLFTFFGAFIWLFTQAVQMSYVVIGKADYSEYAVLIATNLEQRGEGGDNDKGEFPGPGEFWNVSDLNIYLGMISGRQFTGFAKTCLVIATLFYFVQALLWGLGLVMSIKVSPRFGTRGQVFVGLALAVFNFMVMFVMKLLPVLGISGWVVIPFLTPEIVMTEYNMERVIPIHVMWGGVGWQSFFENILNLIVKFAFYLQPVFSCIFLWSVGLHMKDEKLEQGARGLVQMCLGTFFILFVFHLLSLCGASPVLVWILRILYGLWFFFLMMFIISYLVLLWKARTLLYEKMNPKNALDEEEDE